MPKGSVDPAPEFPEGAISSGWLRAGSLGGGAGLERCLGDRKSMGGSLEGKLEQATSTPVCAKHGAESCGKEEAGDALFSGGEPAKSHWEPSAAVLMTRR